MRCTAVLVTGLRKFARCLRSALFFEAPDAGGVQDAADNTPPSYDVILSKLEPWTLACAVGAMNGSIYGSVGSRGVLSFDLWWNIVKTKPFPELGSSITIDQAGQALRRFATEHQRQHMNVVLHEVEQSRGLAKSFVLGPGQTVTVEIGLSSNAPPSVDLKPAGGNQ